MRREVIAAAAGAMALQKQGVAAPSGDPALPHGTAVGGKRCVEAQAIARAYLREKLHGGKGCRLPRPPLHRLDHGGQRDSPKSEEHTSELQSLMRISYAVFCLKTKNSGAHRTTTGV